MPTDCDSITAISKDIARRIRLKPNVMEETLTEVLLTDVSEKISSIRYHDFTRYQESRETGADWDWWFLFSGAAVRLRIQAKKLKDPAKNYSGINYKDGDQLSKLKSSSKKENAMPFYVLYAETADPTKCRMGKIGDGAFIVDASTVTKLMEANGEGKISSSELLQNSLPISCVVCCPLISDPRYPSGALFAHYFPSTTKMAAGADFPDGYHQQAPDHIVDFAEVDSEKLDMWVEENRQFFKGSTRVVTYDLRRNS